MIYEEKDGLRIVRPSDNLHKIVGYDKSYDEEGNEILEYYDVVYLSKYQNEHDYYEVSIYDLPNYEFPSELAKFTTQLEQQQIENDERDSMIIDLSVKIAEMELTMM